MPGDYNKTHERILESAEAQFLDKGYERTNLREVCRGAGVTVGAFYNHFKDKHSLFAELVGPCVKGIHQKYDAAASECYAQLSSEDILKAWDVSNNTVKDFINIIYDNFTGFRLLILCSDGTEFSSFVEDLVKIEENGAFIFFEEMRKRDIKVNQPPSNTIHMLIHTFFTAVFDCVVHNYTREEALTGIDSFITFYNTGWQKLLGLDSL